MNVVEQIIFISEMRSDISNNRRKYSMKLFNLDGELVNVDVRPSTYPVKGISKSKLQTEVGRYLQNKYPRESILEEFYIPNSKLSIDFFMPQMKICIEIDRYSTFST